MALSTWLAMLVSLLKSSIYNPLSSYYPLKHDICLNIRRNHFNMRDRILVMARRNSTVKIGLVVVGAVALVAFTIWGAIWVSNIDKRKAAAQFPACTGAHAVHKADIQNDKVVSAHISATRCDTLVITNLDERPRIIAFGQHDKHVAYDGVTERYLSPEGKFEVTLIQPGNFRFHDHDQDEVVGTFTVTQ
jgi:hypothetical protein